MVQAASEIKSNKFCFHHKNVGGPPGEKIDNLRGRDLLIAWKKKKKKKKKQQ